MNATDINYSLIGFVALLVKRLAVEPETPTVHSGVKQASRDGDIVLSSLSCIVDEIGDFLGSLT